MKFITDRNCKKLVQKYSAVVARNTVLAYLNRQKQFEMYTHVKQYPTLGTVNDCFLQ